jgi:uncharacterized protein (TIGR02117 family)
VKYLRRFFKWSGIALLSLIGLVALYLLSAFILSRIGVAAEPDGGRDVTVYLMTNGVHADIVMPVRHELIDWSLRVPYINTRKKDTAMQYIALGWGDRGFYMETPTWADLRFSVAFNAAFGLGRSAIHATYYRTIKEGPECIRIDISRAQYGRLIAYIHKSFGHNAAGGYVYIPSDAAYGAYDAFYAATGRYSLFHTCNTWANNALKSCGQKAALWTPFDAGIFYHYR